MNIQDTWENRIEQASKIMGITPEKLESILNSKGFEITKEPSGIEMLSDEQITPFGDLRKLFCEDNGIAVPKLRMAITYLRGSVKDSTKKYVDMIDPDLVELQQRFGIKFRLDDLGVEDLIPLYKPNKNNRITEALRKKFGNDPIIAFKPDSSEVAIEETINYLADLEQGFDKEETVDVDGELVRLYPLGVIPNQQVDEDPLFVGVPLKRDRSTMNRVNWDGINLETRQFFRLLMAKKDIDPNNRIALSQILGKTFQELKDIFPETYLFLKECKANGSLPILKMSLTEANASTKYTTSKTNNPFGINRKY
jgi:hypothetical protein